MAKLDNSLSINAHINSGGPVRGHAPPTRPPPEPRHYYKAHEVAKAVRECKGMISLTAKRLGLTQAQVRVYVDRYESVRSVFEESRAEFLDAAELTVWKKVQDGDLHAAMFVLKTLGKERGYVEKHETKVEGTIIHEHIHVWKERLQAAHNALEERRTKAIEGEFKTVTPAQKGTAQSGTDV